MIEVNQRDLKHLTLEPRKWYLNLFLRGLTSSLMGRVSWRPWVASGSSWMQGWKNPGFLKKTQPGGFFFVFFLFFWVFKIYLPSRVSRVFSVSRILLGASRL
jgi:hypothetical protein